MKISIISFLFFSTIVCYGQNNNSSDDCFNTKQYDHQILNDWYSIIGNSNKKEFFIEVKTSQLRTIYCCLFDSTTYTITVVSYNINKDEVKYNFVEKEYYLFSNFSIKNVELKSGIGEGVLYNPKFIPIKEVISQDCCGKVLSRDFVYRDGNVITYSYFYSENGLKKVEVKDNNSILLEEITITYL